MKPCEWCEREDQATCPDCNGTGFVEATDSEGNESELPDEPLTSRELVQPPAHEEPDELDRILIDYRSMVADLLRDSHDRGVTTEQLVAIDDEAKAALKQYVEQRKIEAQIVILEEFLPGQDSDLEHYRHVMENRVEFLRGQLTQTKEGGEDESA